MLRKSFMLDTDMNDKSIIVLKICNFWLPVSAARKVDKKVANLLLKVAQKVTTLKNQLKTSLNF